MSGMGGLALILIEHKSKFKKNLLVKYIYVFCNTFKLTGNSLEFLLLTFSFKNAKGTRLNIVPIIIKNWTICSQISYKEIGSTTKCEWGNLYFLKI